LILGDRDMTRICVSLTEETTAAVIERMSGLEGTADLFEVRADRVLDLDLLTLIRARRKPLVLACRSRAHGGDWPDDDPGRALALLEGAKRGFDYVDVEHDSGLTDVMQEKAGRGLILSHHDLTGTPLNLDGLYSSMRDQGADIVKMAVTPRSIADVARLLAFAERTARGDGPPLIAIGMGPLGLITRVVSGRYGAPFMYAAAERGVEAAPGQLPAQRLAGMYRVRDVGRATRVYGVLGQDVTRSLSPALHNSAFAALGLDAVYVPLQAEALAPFVEALPVLGLSGFSVTRPYKVDVIRYLDGMDEMASACGSVNTVTRDGARLFGRNTDGAGTVGPLRRRTPLGDRRVVIVGAGGAARAAALALRAEGARVTVVARDPAQAARVAAAVSCAHGVLADLARYPWDVLINATPVGGRASMDETPVPAELHRPGAVVFDMVYDPLETRLLREAQQKGCVIVDGLEMLLAQAALQFEGWTGQRAPMEAMKAAALYLVQEQA
jgi:3-dehydroquinate dehydratase/shikimate dehydrogenase